MARTSPYDTGELTDVILVVLLCAQRPTHGYSLMTEASQITDGSIKLGPATIYTTLSRLLEVGWIEEITPSGPNSHKPSEKERREYLITSLGQKVLRNDIERRRKLLTVVETLVSNFSLISHDSQKDD